MLVYGKQSINYLIEKHTDKIETLFLAKEVEKKEYSRLMKMGFEVKRIPQDAANKISKSGNHQGYLAEVKDKEYIELSAICTSSLVLVLNDVTDVGNIGAILRNAYALGVGGVVVCGLKQLNLEGIAKSSSGALFDIPLVLQNNIYDVINELKLANYITYGAVLDGVDIREAGVATKSALIIGSEGTGLHPRVIKKIDCPITIKMENGFNSLNVASASAILIDRMR
ncbi:MAG: 23S rRNA (guanosine(2251)-2'-O)-methyltransferase RlmB [Helicobacteraceae bacterium]|nr:23S rRNA (guanosine(2251)-2'-O)-methyltransferase RlmB [Helicobacteraceae bacterium]